MPKCDGLFASKEEGLGLPSFSILGLWWIRPTGSFSVEFQVKQANSNTVLYPSSLSLHHETSN